MIFFYEMFRVQRKQIPTCILGLFGLKLYQKEALIEQVIVH